MLGAKIYLITVAWIIQVTGSPGWLQTLAQLTGPAAAPTSILQTLIAALTKPKTLVVFLSAVLDGYVFKLWFLTSTLKKNGSSGKASWMGWFLIGWDRKSTGETTFLCSRPTRKQISHERHADCIRENSLRIHLWWMSGWFGPVELPVLRFSWYLLGHMDKIGRDAEWRLWI